MYFHEPHGLYVNLYLPSTVRWSEQGAQVSLTQASAYPYSDHIGLRLQLSAPREFSLRLRIPAWARGAAVAVNGRRVAAPVVPGHFASLRRLWQSGDRIELELPRALRLEPIDTAHPGTVALMAGPLVLFALNDRQGRFSRAQLLAARNTGLGSWQATSDRGPVSFLPYTSIEDQQYSTYLKLS
jgi:DUF1680 family protein